MPLLGTRGAASAKAFGLTAGGASLYPFIAKFTNVNDIQTAVVFNDSAVAFAVSLTSGGYPRFGSLAAVTHTRQTTSTANDSFTFDVVGQKNQYNNTAYIPVANTGYARISSANSLSGFKNINSSYGGLTSTGEYVPSENYFYSAMQGLTTYGSGRSIIVSRINNSTGANVNTPRAFNTDSSFNGNLYPCSAGVTSTNFFIGMRFGYLARLTKNFGTFVLYNFAGSFSGTNVFGSCVDSNDNITFVFNGSGTPGNGIYVITYNNDFSSVVASKLLTNISTAYTDISSMTIDPLTGDYFMCIQTGTNPMTMEIHRFSSSFTPIYSRRISYNAGQNAYIIGSITLAGNYMCVYTKDIPIIIVLPKDGTKTGSYTVGTTTVTYSSISTPTVTSFSTSVVWTNASGYYDTYSTTTGAVSFSSAGTQPTVSTVNIT